jgi:glutamate synthase (NADPH/NADH) small chain
MKIGPWKWNASMTVYGWMLHILKRSRCLRKIIPGWHKHEHEYLRQYESAVAGFAYSTNEEYQQQLARLTSARCMDCLNPRCAEAGLMGTGCPLESDVPQWVQLAREGKWREAAGKLSETNNFPEFTSRICPAFCESACKQKFSGFPVGIKDIERQIIDRALAEGWVTPEPASEKTGKTVAVVGSGPTGLAAAQQLARAGQNVTVFEAEDAPGGLLRYGIPQWRLGAELIDWRIEQLAAEGVTFRTSTQVGKDITANELHEQFDAVLLAVGASVPKDLKIPGREIRGVQFGIDFLHDGENASVKDKTVAVIGGGLTGEDCVEAAITQGAKKVHQFEILPESASPTIQHENPENNVERQWCVATKSFSGDGNLASLKAVRVEWKPSTNGPVMAAVPGSEFSLDVDVVLLAMGFDAVLPKPIAEQLALTTGKHGGIIAKSCATNVPGIFAAGDLVTGPSYVATAIAAGRNAAEKIDEYLTNIASTPREG